MAEPSARPSFQIPGGARGKPAQILVLSFAAVLFSLIFLGSCTTYIHPDEVGVMESRVFGVRGVRPGTLGGGRLHFLMPGQSIHTFPTDIQLMLFSDDPSDQRLSRNVRNVLLKPAVEVNTSDGSKVGVDVTVMYRIADAYTVMQQAGPGRIFEMNAVYPKAISALKKNLGEMLAEDFYDVKKRTAKVEAAEKQIREELLPKGIAVDHVMVRQYRYNAAYEQQINDKKIQDQLVFTNEAQAEAAKEKAKLQQIEATGKANVDVEQQRGNAEVVKIQAEADNYKRKREAEANLLVQLSTAKGTELENAAYQGVGSENLVGMKMADVLQGLDVIVVPSGGKNGVNPLDLEQSLKLFDVKGGQ